MLTFEKMRPEERSACAELAARAFGDYEYFTCYIPDEQRRTRFLRTMLEIEIRINDGPADFFTAKEDGNIVAVAMLCPPEYKKPSDMAYMRAGFGRCFIQGGIRDVAAWNDMEGKAGEPCHSLGGQTWYLNLLTVEPARKGQGFGSRMLQECILPYVRDHGGETLCLFTNAESNRKFYQKNGFEEFDQRFFNRKGKQLGSWSYRISFTV